MSNEIEEKSELNTDDTTTPWTSRSLELAQRVGEGALAGAGAMGLVKAAGVVYNFARGSKDTAEDAVSGFIGGGSSKPF